MTSMATADSADVLNEDWVCGTFCNDDGDWQHWVCEVKQTHLFLAINYARSAYRGLVDMIENFGGPYRQLVGEISRLDEIESAITSIAEELASQEAWHARNGERAWQVAFYVSKLDLENLVFVLSWYLETIRERFGQDKPLPSETAFYDESWNPVGEEIVAHLVDTVTLESVTASLRQAVRIRVCGCGQEAEKNGYVCPKWKPAKA